MLIVISYVPLFMTSSSFLPQSLLNVGKALVLIQTWKCSSSFKAGKVSYPPGYLSCQLGGTA